MRSDRKGKRGEREVRDVFRSGGFDCERTPNSGGLRWKGDLRGIPRVHVEVKRAERLAVPAWLRQTYADCPEGHLPVLAFRCNRRAAGDPLGTWHAVVPLDDFVRLLREASS